MATSQPTTFDEFFNRAQELFLQHPDEVRILLSILSDPIFSREDISLTYEMFHTLPRL